MLAGEAGADYVMFGEPDRRGGRPPFDAIVERVEWWAELFELPCVGYAAASTRSRRWRRLAPISSRSVIGYGRKQKRPLRRSAAAAGRLAEPVRPAAPG